MTLDSLAVRALCVLATPRLKRDFAVRALLRAYHVLAVALGKRLAELRDSDDPLARRFARAEELSYQLPLALSAAHVLAARWTRVPERKRPHYLPEERFQILRTRASLILSAKETATLFAVSESTIHRWESDLRRASTLDADTKSIGRNYQPSPPIRRYADAVRAFAVHLSAVGVGGSEKVAQTMARLGYAISARTVGRIRREKTIPVAPPPDPSPARPGSVAGTGLNKPAPTARKRRLDARGPLDKVHIDITQVKSLFGFFRFRIAVVLDLFSRFPIAFSVFRSEPTAIDLLVLVEKALVVGRPRVLVTDQGSVFTSEVFRTGVAALGIEQRFGALYQHASIARLERLWRSMKDSLFHPVLRRRLVLADLDKDVAAALAHYALFRPHTGLDGATPAEVFLRLPPAHLSAVPPPRGRPGEVVPFPEFVTESLGPQLPVVYRKAA